MTDRERDLRTSIEVAVENLEEERLEPPTRIRIALGVLRGALKRDRQRRDSL